MQLQYYHRISRLNTLAFNAAFLHGKGLEEGRQFILGGETGLRGYPARQFNGNKRFLVNLENRLFSSLQVFTVAIGGVLFADAGHVWPRGAAIDFGALHYSTGLGLRLGFTRLPNSDIARLDFAWRLNDGGFGVSIGYGQHFTLQ
jgi:outer membrane protein assembly factor BamA